LIPDLLFSSFSLLSLSLSLSLPPPFSSPPSNQKASLYSIMMGASASFIGTCIQHDGSHGAFSTKSWLNTTAGWTLDMIGASAFTWEIQHVLGHHPYTNLMSVDNEISLQRNEQKATTELSQGKKKKKNHRDSNYFF